MFAVCKITKIESTKHKEIDETRAYSPIMRKNTQTLLIISVGLHEEHPQAGSLIQVHVLNGSKSEANFDIKNSATCDLKRDAEWACLMSEGSWFHRETIRWKYVALCDSVLHSWQMSLRGSEDDLVVGRSRLELLVLKMTNSSTLLLHICTNKDHYYVNVWYTHNLSDHLKVDLS